MKKEQVKLKQKEWIRLILKLKERKKEKKNGPKNNSN